VKRKALQIQIEQLRAARDVLATFVTSVQDQLKMCSPESTTPMKWLATRRSRPATSTEHARADRRRGPRRHTTAKGLRADTARGDRSARRDENTRPRASKEGVAVVAEVTEVSMIGDDDSGNDVVNEIFARLRKATLEERGAAPVPKKAAPAPAKA